MAQTVGRRSTNKKIRSMAKALELVKALGIDVGTADPEGLVREARLKEIEAKRGDVLEASLRSIHKPHAFTYRKCKHCESLFGTSYYGVSYCSDSCRIIDFNKTTGMTWSGDKSPEERWGGEPPMVVPPEVIKQCLPWAIKIVEAAKEAGLDPQEIEKDLDAEYAEQIATSGIKHIEATAQREVARQSLDQILQLDDLPTFD
jgi:hypothetical protein